MSDDDDVFRGMHPKKSLCPKTNKTRKKSKTSLSSLFFFSFPLLFSFLSFLSFPHNKKLLPFLGVALVFILSARRTSHLSEFTQFRRAHTSSRAETKILSVVLRSFNTIKSVLREKRERRERVVCGYSCAFIVLIGEKSTHRWLTNRHLICFFLSKSESHHASHRRRTVVSRKSLAGRVVGSCARATRIRKKNNAGEENDDDAREDKEEHFEYYKY